jgi:hypothetical protein
MDQKTVAILMLLTSASEKVSASDLSRLTSNLVGFSYVAAFIGSILLYLFCLRLYATEIHKKKEKNYKQVYIALSVTTVITLCMLLAVAGFSTLMLGFVFYPFNINKVLGCESMEDNRVSYWSGRFASECFFERAQKEDDPSLCGKLSDYAPEGYESDLYFTAPTPKRKSECLMYFAFSRNDSSLCDQISHKMVRAHCMAYLTKNSSLCDEIAGEGMKGECYKEADTRYSVSL